MRGGPADDRAVGYAAESLRIVPVVGGNQMLVSFELSDAYTTEVHDAIASGLRTTFTYDVQLRMIVPTWVDRTIATTVVTTIDQCATHPSAQSVENR